MRRNYISPEFESSEVFGTFNMVEESNFFGAKMLEVEDSIYVDNQNIIYYQLPSGEQLDLSVENTLQSQVYSADADKKSKHRLTLDPTQTDYQKENSTNWILEIDLKGILSSYIYAQMKTWRTFEGIKNGMTYYNDVNTALNKYIEFNVVDRYKAARIDLYIQYRDLRSQTLLKFSNTWKQDASLLERNRMAKFQSETSVDGSYTKLTFAQLQPGSTYAFDYYFNIFYEKI
jgi:hypothetical protein